MESRRVTLLTEGYLLGWLNFKYPNPSSELRENIILSQIENKKVAEIMQLRITAHASLISGVLVNNPKIAKNIDDEISSYSELTLPYLPKRDNISKAKLPKLPTTPEEIASWKALLAKRNAESKKEKNQKDKG